MKHENGRECTCTIFKDKNISLELVTIHSFISKLENCFQKDQATEWDEYFLPIFRKKIAFYAKLYIRQNIEFSVYTECSLCSLVWLMRCYGTSLYQIDLITETEYKNDEMVHENCVDKFAPDVEFFIIIPWENF